MTEPNTITLGGLPLLLQWFERARFECTRQRAAYRVLLGRLGVEFQSYNPSRAPAPPPAAPAYDDATTSPAGLRLDDAIRPAGQSTPAQTRKRRPPRQRNLHGLRGNGECSFACAAA